MIFCVWSCVLLLHHEEISNSWFVVCEILLWVISILDLLINFYVLYITDTFKQRKIILKKNFIMYFNNVTLIGLLGYKTYVGIDDLDEIFWVITAYAATGLMLRLIS